MNWRDELYRDESGRARFVTCMVIVNDELDQTYATNDTVHTIVNVWVTFGVKVGAA